MAATIIGGNSPQFEPGIISENGRDGISRFAFTINGRNISSLYPLDSAVVDVPNQPAGSFLVVNRSLETVVGGLQRLSISAEGGVPSGLNIAESGFQYNESQETGYVFFNDIQLPVVYKLIWLSPSATVTTNSSSASDGPATTIAKQIVGGMSVQVIQDRPSNVKGGKKIDTDDIKITGSSVEKAGGLWRVRATATKGQIPGP